MLSKKNIIYGQRSIRQTDTKRTICPVTRKKLMYIICCLLIPLISASQTPGKGYYKEEELQLTLKTGRQLYGTLTVPEENSKGIVAIILAGSGPADRNGNQNGLMYPNSFKFIAHELASSGISSLRYDKSNVGVSMWPNFNEKDLLFDSYVSNLLDWIDLLKADKRTKKIVLIGHSEGTLISMLAASKINVDGYIGVAGPSLPFDSTLLRQIRVAMPTQYENAVRITDSINAGAIVTNIPAALKPVFRPSVQPYLKSVAQYDPRKLIEALKCPILLVQGDNDLQIKTEDAIALSEANPAAKLVIVKGMNHVLKNCPRDPQLNMKTYHSPVLPLDSMLMPAITAFIEERVK
jgi:pimeloyl-ACP methyl ester carboxylesterase